MFQDILPHSIAMGYGKNRPDDDDRLVVVQNGKIFLIEKDGEKRFPTVGEGRELFPIADDELVFLFTFDEKPMHFFLGSAPDIADMLPMDMQTLRTFSPSWLGFVGMTAGHLALWYQGNRFCGRCGGKNEIKEDERAVRCHDCGQIVYPRISPATITGVLDGDRIILTRYNRPGSRLTALVAGFMEVGETFEDTIRREVMEEIGLKIKNIRYYKSQPWAFSGSVLAGFYADLNGPDTLTIDPVELAEARWIHRKDLADNLDTFSLTAEMINTFRLNKHPK